MKGSYLLCAPLLVGRAGGGGRGPLPLDLLAGASSSESEELELSESELDESESDESELSESESEPDELSDEESSAKDKMPTDQKPNMKYARQVFCLRNQQCQKHSWKLQQCNKASCIVWRWGLPVALQVASCLLVLTSTGYLWSVLFDGSGCTRSKHEASCKVKARQSGPLTGQ